MTDDTVRYVILEHDHPFLHWDLMLESGDVLRTWRLLGLPGPEKVVQAESIGDHRQAYLEYEGPVSGNRGQVKRWDSGVFTWEADTAHRVVVRLAGKQCRGVVVLDRTEGQAWRLEYHPTKPV